MIQLPWLDDDPSWFPSTGEALHEPEGLLAAGGDLSPERLINAYALGIFPWFEEGQPILWWSPTPRLVLNPGDIHISRSMRKVMRSDRFTIRFDTAFREVMTACSEPRENQSGTWITDDMIDAYCSLHTLGFAHSVETWVGDELVGGLYGLSLGRVFFGESMFSRQSNASKLALIALAQRLAGWKFGMIDCQVATEHLESLGAVTMNRATFERKLADNLAVGIDYQRGSWRADNV